MPLKNNTWTHLYSIPSSHPPPTPYLAWIPTQCNGIKQANWLIKWFFDKHKFQNQETFWFCHLSKHNVSNSPVTENSSSEIMLACVYLTQCLPFLSNIKYTFLNSSLKLRKFLMLIHSLSLFLYSYYIPIFHRLCLSVLN